MSSFLVSLAQMTTFSGKPSAFPPFGDQNWVIFVIYEDGENGKLQKQLRGQKLQREMGRNGLADTK